MIRDSVHGMEIARLMKDASAADIVNQIFNDPSGLLKIIQAGGAKGRKAFRVVQQFYSLGDDFWRILGFHAWSARFVEWGNTPEKATELAAERIRDIYPSYSNLPRAISGLRRMPLFGPFVSYQMSLFITTFQPVSYYTSPSPRD